MFILSGPVELLFLLDLIASKTCVTVIVILVDSSLAVCLFMILFSCDVYLTACVNCLLKAVAICVFDILSLLLKLMVLFGCALGELSASVFIVFHRM